MHVHLWFLYYRSAAHINTSIAVRKQELIIELFFLGLTQISQFLSSGFSLVLFEFCFVSLEIVGLQDRETEV